MQTGILLSNGKTALLDPKDVLRFSEFSWYDHTGYAARNHYENGVKVRTSFLHHEVLGVSPTRYVVDHINRNRLDNRKSNLRLVTQQENSFNRGPNKNKQSSKFKGVFWSKDKSLWFSSIKLDGVSHHLGYFASERDAAIAYNSKAIELFKEQAFLNNVPTDNQWWKRRIFTGHGSSPFRGVTEQRPGKWQARITVDGRRLSLGYFNSAIEAALAYNEAAIKHHGEKALLNIIEN